MDCPDFHTLTEFVSGILPSGRRADLRRHLADCTYCCAAAGDLAGHLQEPAGIRPERTLRRLRPALLAAGLILTFSGVLAWTLLPRVDGRTWTWMPLQTPAEPVELGGRSERRLLLPDGSRLTVEPGASLRMIPRRAGERTHLELSAGGVSVDVPPGEGLFRITGPAGEVRVLGTRFRLRAFTLHPAADAVLPCLCAEVNDGAISLRNPTGSTRVGAGQRGVCASNQKPFLQDPGASRDALLEGFARLLETGGTIPRIKPGLEPQAIALAAVYWGTAEGPPLPPSDVVRFKDAWVLLRRWKEQER